VAPAARGRPRRRRVSSPRRPPRRSPSGTVLPAAPLPAPGPPPGQAPLHPHRHRHQAPDRIAPPARRGPFGSREDRACLPVWEHRFRARSVGRSVARRAWRPRWPRRPGAARRPSWPAASGVAVPPGQGARPSGRAVTGAAGADRRLPGLGAESLPFPPLTACSRDLVRDLGAGRVAALAAAAAAGNWPCCRRIRCPPAPTRTREARARLFEPDARDAGSTWPNRPVVLVIEDTHWRNKSTRTCCLPDPQPVPLDGVLNWLRSANLPTLPTDATAHRSIEWVSRMASSTRLDAAQMSDARPRRGGPDHRAATGDDLPRPCTRRATGQPAVHRALVGTARRARQSRIPARLLMAGHGRLPERPQEVVGSPARAVTGMATGLLTAVTGLDGAASAGRRPGRGPTCCWPNPTATRSRHALIASRSTTSCCPARASGATAGWPRS